MTQRQAWDMYPLQSDAWDARWVDDPTGKKAGTTDQARAHYYFQGQLHKPRRLFYFPTDEEQQAIETILPDVSMPRLWRRIEAALIASGYSHADLVKLDAVSLVRLLIGKSNRVQAIEPTATDSVTRESTMSTGTSSNTPTIVENSDSNAASDFQFDGEWLTADLCGSEFDLDDTSLSRWALNVCPHLEGRKLPRQKFPPDQSRWCYHRIDIENIDSALNGDD